MGLFDKRTPLQKEWHKLEAQEQKFLRKRSEKTDGLLARTLEEKVPEKLQDTLNTAFAKAFALVFEKGTGIIEKTYQKEMLELDYKLRQYTADTKGDRKSLKASPKKARGAGTRNLLLSGVSGVGLGVLGIGIPDIPVFTGMVLRNLYETALHFGFGYDTPEEKYFILLLIQGAVSHGDALGDIDRQANDFIRSGQLPEDYDEKAQIKQAASALSKDLLYMKFLQGIPVVGVVGGAYDALCMGQISAYAGLKYRRRYLLGQKARET